MGELIGGLPIGLGTVSGCVPGGGAGGFSSGREGSLYVSPRAVGFSTMLSGDLKATTDITVHVKRKVKRGRGRGSQERLL